MFIPFIISESSLVNLGYNNQIDYAHENQLGAYHKSQLREYLLGTDGIIDGDRLSKLWFPKGDYDVFISHSHADINKAHFLAKWLEINCGLKCFIDADVWGSAFELLKEIEKNNCKLVWNGKEYVYDEEQCSLASSHVFSMLSIALMEAIDNIECPIFIESNNSTPLKTNIQSKTLSPWIYEEVSFMNKLQRKKPAWFDEIRYFSAENRQILLEKAYNSLKISHEIPTKGLTRIYSKHIKSMSGLNKRNALRALYNSLFL